MTVPQISFLAAACLALAVLSATSAQGQVTLGGGLLGGGPLLGSPSSLLGSGSLLAGTPLGSSAGSTLSNLTNGSLLGGLLSNPLTSTGSLLNGLLNSGPLNLGGTSLLGSLDTTPLTGIVALPGLQATKGGVLEPVGILSRVGTFFPGGNGSQFPYAPDGSVLLGVSPGQVFGVQPLGAVGAGYSSRLYGHDPYSGVLGSASSSLLPAASEPLTLTPLRLTSPIFAAP